MSDATAKQVEKNLDQNAVNAAGSKVSNESMDLLKKHFLDKKGDKDSNSKAIHEGSNSCAVMGKNSASDLPNVQIARPATAEEVAKAKQDGTLKQGIPADGGRKDWFDKLDDAKTGSGKHIQESRPATKDEIDKAMKDGKVHQGIAIGVAHEATAEQISKAKKDGKLLQGTPLYPVHPKSDSNSN